MQYHFKDIDGDGEPDQIIFVKKEEVFSLNYLTEEIKTIHKFQNEIRQMPTQFAMSYDERYYVIASVMDGYWVDIQTGKEIDLDDLFEVELIRHVLYDDEHKKFYFLTNKYKGKIGFYLIEFDFDNP